MVEMSYRFHPKLDALLTNGEAVWKLKELATNEELGREIQKGMASPEFVARLDRIEKILLHAGAKMVNRVALKSLMVTAGLVYGEMPWFAERASMMTLHEAAEPIAHLLKIFKSDENRAALLHTLGASAHVPAKGAEAAHAAALKSAQMRLDHLLHGLEEIGSKLPPPPQKERVKRDFDALVHLLAQHFEEMTGAQFTQDWFTNKRSRREPLSDGAKFGYEVVEFIDSKRLVDLPGAARRVVSDRRNGTFQKSG
jgi:hypothetical protein